MNKFAGLSRDWVDDKQVVYVFLGVSPYERGKHISNNPQKSPGQYREKCYEFCSLLVFSLATEMLTGRRNDFWKFSEFL